MKTLSKNREWAIHLSASILIGSVNPRDIQESKYDFEKIVDHAFTQSLDTGEYTFTATTAEFNQIARKYRA